MMKTELVILAILAIISFATGLWPLGLIFIIILIAQSTKTPSKSKNTETKEPDICEFEIYKQAAEIEKHLKEDKP